LSTHSDHSVEEAVSVEDCQSDSTIPEIASAQDFQSDSPVAETVSVDDFQSSSNISEVVSVATEDIHSEPSEVISVEESEPPSTFVDDFQSGYEARSVDETLSGGRTEVLTVNDESIEDDFIEERPPKPLGTN
jgi:hypothetical protein